MKKIKIAEPCHENWNDFTPTQRGAFCGSCQINVIDFSVKSNEEIKGILIQNSGKKMCGRFSKPQLDELNSDYHLWQNQSQNTFQSKFIFALILVFGLTLFSCSSQNDNLVMGEMTTLITGTSSVILTDTIKTDSTKTLEITTETQGTTCTPEMLMGDIAIIEPIEMTMGELPVEYYEKEEMVKGKLAIEPEVIEIKSVEKIHTMTLGMVAYYEEPEIIPSDIADSIKNVTTENNIVISLTDKFEANLYPNPFKNNATIDLLVLTKETYQIGLFDSQGRLIKSVYSGILEIGKVVYNLDLTTEENGIYFVKIVTETQNESLKVIKIN